jgi:hypothetical protein
MNSTQTATRTADELAYAVEQVGFWRTALTTAKTSKQVVEADEQLNFWIGKRTMLTLKLEQGR